MQRSTRTSLPPICMKHAAIIGLAHGAHGSCRDGYQAPVVVPEDHGTADPLPLSGIAPVHGSSPGETLSTSALASPMTLIPSRVKSSCLEWWWPCTTRRTPRERARASSAAKPNRCVNGASRVTRTSARSPARASTSSGKMASRCLSGTQPHHLGRNCAMSGPSTGEPTWNAAQAAT